jgi:hypothetical protein
MRYSIGARTVATAAAADHAGAALWNPHASVRLEVVALEWFKTVATVDNLAIVRLSARGTAGSTVTPGAQSGIVTQAVPPSGALLDLAAYSVQPTIIGTGTARYIRRTNLPAAIGSGVMWMFTEPIEIPPGQGLAVITPAAVILQPADVSFEWKE